MSASVGGECAAQSRPREIEEASAAGMNSAVATAAGRLAIVCWSEPDFASGWNGAPVRWYAVLQQVLFKQHPGVHAFSLGVPDAMHGLLGSRIAAKNTATASITRMPTLLRIALLV